jgi:hypothetical protein
MSRVLPAEDIRIRVGPDALSELAPTQQAPEAPHRAASLSDASSDTMLFDYGDPHVALNPSPKPAQIRDQNRHTFVGVQTQGRAAPPQMRGEGLQAHQPADLNGDISYRTRTCNAAHGERIPHEHVQGSFAGHTSTYEEDKVSGCCITQRIGNVDRPLRLVVDRTPDFSALEEEDTAAHGYVIGEPNHDPGLANASLRGFGNQQDQSDADRAVAGQPHIVDDGPWRSFLAIADNSSNRSPTASASKTDRMHCRPTLQASKMAETLHVPWSQHATQGAQTRTNSTSGISVVLPLVTRGSERKTLRKQPQTERKPVTDSVNKQRDMDEYLWQTFVFRNGIPATSDSAGDYAEVNAAYSTSSRRVIPSTLLVGSLSSTPSEHISGLTTRERESVQDPTDSEPMLPRITSSRDSSIRWQAQERSESGEGNVTRQTAEHSGFGHDSATRTSIQNNVSYSARGTPVHSSGPWPQTSCTGLHQGKGCQTDLCGPVQLKRNEPASVYDIPVSDQGEEEDTLDLVEY